MYSLNSDLINQFEDDDKKVLSWVHRVHTLVSELHLIKRAKGNKSILINYIMHL